MRWWHRGVRHRGVCHRGGWGASTVLVVLALPMLGCWSVVDTQVPQADPIDIPVRWREGERADVRHAVRIPAINPSHQNMTQHLASVAWWRIFNDETLNTLVARALAQNWDVHTAWLRVEEAQALTRALRRDRKPNVAFNMAGERTRRTTTNSNPGASVLRSDFSTDVGLSWQLDWFNQKAQAIQGREAEEKVAEAEAQGVVLATVVEVVKSYYTYRGLQERLRIAVQNTELLKTAVGLIQARYAVGEVSEFDVVRGQGAYQSSRARVPELMGALRASAQGLSVLLGDAPGALEDVLRDEVALPTLSFVLDLGQPADVLTQRPDIARAEAQVLVNLAEHGVAVADLYPKLRLDALLGLDAARVSDVFTGRSRVWSVGTFLNWPLLDQRTRGALVEAARHRLSASLLAYEALVLRALATVESTIATYAQARETCVRYREVVTSQQRAHELALELYEVGEIDYLSLIDAERELVSSQDEWALARIDALVLLANLYGELGGGWRAVAATGTAESGL
ncbi:MAG: TolC family protein [Gammaproteobacteria bacterium]